MLALPNFKKNSSGNGPADRPGPSRNSGPTLEEVASLEALIARAEHAAEQLRSLDESTDRMAQLSTMAERLAIVERTMAGVERLEAQLKVATDRSARLTAAQERAEGQISASGAEVERVHESCSDLVEKIAAAFELRDQLDRFLAFQPQFLALRGEADSVATQVRELTAAVGRLRAVHDDALRAYKHATARLDGIEQRSLTTAGTMDAIERRANSAEEALDALLRITATIPDVHHQLNVLKATSEQVAQKAALVEQQREAVDRAAGQVAQLLALNPQLETALHRHEEQSRVVSAIEAKLIDVQSQHDSVVARAGEIAATQRQLDEAEREATRTLGELRDEMQASAERFELENQSLDAVSERIAELRGGVAECEARVAGLAAVRRSIEETDTRARTLVSQVTTVEDDVNRIATQAERLRAVRDDVGQLDRTLEEVTRRMDRVEELRPTLDAVTRDLGTLRGIEEVITDGLEQVRLAYAEMTRLRERQTETDEWLSDANRRMSGLQGHVTELERLRPGVEALRVQVDQLAASSTALEGRSKTVNELHGRLSDLESRVAQLHERSDTVRSRMDAADNRFTDLSRQAAEAQRVASTMGAVSAAVEATEQRLDSIGGTMDTLDSRAKALDGLGDRLRAFTQEIEQRQGALDKAAEHLARAADMRRQAADAAERLEEVTREVGAQLGAADARAANVSHVLHELDGRVAALGNVERRMGHFEELLAKWELAQSDAALALEQVGSRKAMIDAVHGQIGQVVGLAERATESVRSITAARQEIEDTRELLETTRDQLKGATETMREFSGRSRQVEELERRIARADALALNVRSSVETIAAQRVYVDQALERSSGLTFQMKQAEALIEALRSDVTMATKLRHAVDDAKD